ncbi:MAG: dienelactone hydrolase family protein [Myxococcota bacterium]|nr:dienelactone hydrolase family protein [Myxococcota bacterium]
MQIDVRFPCDDGHELPGVLTLPAIAHGEPRPALLLVYEVFGLVPEMKRVAQDLANEGYVVLIPDLFDRGPKPICIARAVRAISQQKGQPLDDLEAARRWLAARPEVDASRLGVIGFCMGGGFALVLAMTGRYQVAAPFYGQAPATMSSSCPVVASFGGRDLSFAKFAPRLRKNLEELGVPHDVKLYPEAGHSFYTHTPAGVMGFLGSIGPMRAGHHEESARDAHARILAFFREHLDGAQRTSTPDVAAEE